LFGTAPLAFKNFFWEKESSFKMVDSSKIFTKFPPGPLDIYRKKASFDWYEMKRFIDGEELLETKEHIWSVLAKDPLFKKTTRGLSIEEKRRLTFLKIKRLVEYDFAGEIGENPLNVHGIADAIGSINWGLMAKFQLHHQVVANCV
jgi:acyl-CoA oxidase